jgi:hypothetical protein
LGVVRADAGVDREVGCGFCGDLEDDRLLFKVDGLVLISSLGLDLEEVVAFVAFVAGDDRLVFFLGTILKKT